MAFGALRFECLFGEDLVHVASRLGAARLADDACGNAGDRLVVRDRVKDHRARRHPRAIANLDIAEDLRPRSDQDAMADLRMPVTSLLAGAAEGHALEYRNVVLDHRGLADHEAGRMIEK